MNYWFIEEVGMTANQETSNILSTATDAISRTFFRGYLGAANAAQNGNNIKAGGQAAQQTNKLKDVAGDAKAAWNEIKKLDQAAGVGLTAMGSDKVTEWGFFRNTFLESKLEGTESEWLLKADTNLARTSLGQRVIKAAGGEVKTIVTAAGKTELQVVGSTAGKVTANTLAKIPILGLLFSAALETPDVIKACENGDGLNQAGRSGINIALTTTLTALGSTVCKMLPTKYKVTASLIGGAIGAYVGSKSANAIGESTFGESLANAAEKKNNNEIAQA